MRGRQGSWPWLLQHELRIVWRDFADHYLSSGTGGAVLALCALLWLVYHLPASLLMRYLAGSPLDANGLLVAGLAFWLAFTLMLSTGIVLAINALFDRGDFDLLLSSPLEPVTVFTVRGIGVGAGAVALFAALALPLAHGGLLQGEWHLVLMYPVIAGIALIVAALAFTLTLTLVRAFGARRARTLAQVLSALTGALFLLLTQVGHFLSDDDGGPFDAGPRVLPDWLGADSALWWPVRALLGEPLPALLLIVTGVGLFVAVIRSTTRLFLAGTQEPAVALSRTASPHRVSGFTEGLAPNVLLKEQRLILRDPNLIAQTLLQVLFLLPMVIVFGRRAEVGTLVGPVAVVMLANIAGNLAWITVAAEEAPDLIDGAPVRRNTLRWLKAAAAVRLVAWLALPFAVFYLLRAPLMALLFVVFAGFALSAAAVTQVWGAKPSRHRDLKRRQKEIGLLNFVEVVGSIAIGGACYLAMSGSWWALAVLPLGLLAPTFAWHSRE